MIILGLFISNNILSAYYLPLYAKGGPKKELKYYYQREFLYCFYTFLQYKYSHLLHSALISSISFRFFIFNISEPFLF